MNLNRKTLSLSALSGLALVLGACERHPPIELDEKAAYEAESKINAPRVEKKAEAPAAEVPAPKKEAPAAVPTPETEKKFFPQSN